MNSKVSKTDSTDALLWAVIALRDATEAQRQFLAGVPNSGLVQQQLSDAVAIADYATRLVAKDADVSVLTEGGAALPVDLLQRAKAWVQSGRRGHVTR